MVAGTWPRGAVSVPGSSEVADSPGKPLARKVLGVGSLSPTGPDRGRSGAGDRRARVPGRPASVSTPQQGVGLSTGGVLGADSCGRPREWRSGELARRTLLKRLGGMDLRACSEFATRRAGWRTRPRTVRPPRHPTPPAEMSPQGVCRNLTVGAEIPGGQGDMMRGRRECANAPQTAAGTAGPLTRLVFAGQAGGET